MGPFLWKLCSCSYVRLHFSAGVNRRKRQRGDPVSVPQCPRCDDTRSDVAHVLRISFYPIDYNASLLNEGD